MAGYRSYSLSNNAVAAYDAGEKPKSKWTKRTILSLCGEKADMLAALTVDELRKMLLKYSGWHHTSCRYNCTEFFAFSEEALANITKEDVAAAIAARHPKANPSVTTITAIIEYTQWEGRYRNYRRPVSYSETVTYASTDKMIQTQNGNKRLSSVKIIKIIKEEEINDKFGEA